MFSIQDIIDYVREAVTRVMSVAFGRGILGNIMRVQSYVIRVIAPKNVVYQTMFIDHFSGRQWNEVTIDKMHFNNWVRCLDIHLPQRYNQAFQAAFRTMNFNPLWVIFRDHWQIRINLARMGVVTFVKLETGEWLISMLSSDEDNKNHCSFLTNDPVVVQETVAIISFLPFFKRKFITDLDAAWAEKQVHKDLGIQRTPFMFVNNYQYLGLTDQERNDRLARREGYMQRWVCRKGLTRLIMSVRDRCVGWKEQDPNNFLLSNDHEPSLWITALNRNQNESGL